MMNLAIDSNILSSSTAILISLSISVGIISETQADDLSFREAINQSSTHLNFRYRLEQVEQKSLGKDAVASTLKTRLTWKTAQQSRYFAMLEFDNLMLLGNDNYNSTTNGKTQYSVVADPTGTDVNQALFGVKQDKMTLTVGRQRINHHQQRFVGGVGWRQNEQTFDGFRIQYQPTSKWDIDYSFVNNVNRILGPDHPVDDFIGNFHLFNGVYQPSQQQSITVYAYYLDFDEHSSLSTETYGAYYDAKVNDVNFHLAMATQSDIADNPNQRSTRYYKVEVDYTVQTINLGVGYESLGSDNQQGFITPLATLHKFQGATDQFLATPGNGVDDKYVKI